MNQYIKLLLENAFDDDFDITMEDSNEEEGLGDDTLYNIAGIVDMGLPSGTLWTTKNIGAKTPYEVGEYFAWGEVKPKRSYTNRNYKLYDNGFKHIDGPLPAKYDVANVKNSNMYIPSIYQFIELKEHTTKAWIQYNDIYCLQFKSKINNNVLILPVGGYVNKQMISSRKEGLYYWLNTDHSTHPMYASCIYDFKFSGEDTVDETPLSTSLKEKFLGLPIRPVMVKK